MTRLVFLVCCLLSFYFQSHLEAVLSTFTILSCTINCQSACGISLRVHAKAILDFKTVKNIENEILVKILETFRFRRGLRTTRARSNFKGRLFKRNPRFRKSLDLQTSFLVGHFKKTKTFLVCTICFHETVHNKWCLH